MAEFTSLKAVTAEIGGSFSWSQAMVSRLALLSLSLRRPNRPSASSATRSAVAAFFDRFKRDTSGGIAIIFALIFVALALFVGGAVDLGRWLQARQQTIAAADAAVLAGARVLQLDNTNVSGARQAALKFYAENTKDRTEVVQDTISFDTAGDDSTFVAKGNAYIKTTFLNFSHISRLPLNVTSRALYKVGGVANSSVEIAMMLDVTGSMAGTKITSLKTAANDLVTIVLGETSDYNPVRVSIVPFAEGVRLPTSANTKARGTPATKVDYTYTQNRQTKTITYYPTECVVERKGTEKYTDAAPAANKYVMTMMNTAAKCGLPAADEMLPLTDNKTTLTNKINGLVLSGATAGHVGTAWAWYTLSPNWNSLWSASSAASAYGSGPRKIAILMTDGEYNLQYDTNGVAVGSTGAGAAVNADSATQAKAVCGAMKAKGITVYTVGFALTDANAINTLATCATDASKAYTPTTGAQLQQAFRDIALKINQLYLTN